MNGRQIVSVLFLVVSAVLAVTGARQAKGSPGRKARFRVALIFAGVGIAMGFWYVMGS